MKKIIAICLLIVPVTSFAIPTVRRTGNAVSASAAGSLSGQPDSKIIPARTATTPKVSASAPSRIGTVRMQPSKQKVTGAISSSGSRFPAGSYGKAFSTMAVPKYEEPKTVNIDTDEIVNVVIDTVEERGLYVKNEGFADAVRGVENPKFDTVNVGQPQDTENLPGRVYMWVEMNNPGN